MKPVSVPGPPLHPANRIAAVLLAAGLAITALIAVLPALTKPFTLDETEIATRAHLILKKGPATFLDGSHYLAHPPLYEYTVAAIFRLFGEDEFPARGFGLILFLLTGIFFKWTLDELLRNEDPSLRRIAVYTGVLLYGINPLLLQHSMELDADTTGTALFTMIFAYCFVRMESRDGVRQWGMRICQALAITMAFLSKEITPVLILTGVFAYRLIGWQWKKFLEDLVGVFAAGALTAWGIWWVYCLFTGTDVMEFIRYTWLKKSSFAMNADFLNRSFAITGWIARWPVYWMSVPFFALLAVTFVRRTAEAVQTRQTRPQDMLWLTAFAVWVPYFYLKGSIDMMKYQHPVYPLFIAAILCGCVATFRHRAEDIASALRDAWWIVPLTAALTAAALWYYFTIGDYILLQWDRPELPRYRHFWNAYHRPLAAALAIAIALRVMGRLRLTEGVLAASLLLCLPVNAALNLNQSGEYTTAESWMNYGESGHRETADYLAAIARPGTMAAVRSDLQYYLDKRKKVEGLQYMSPRDLLIARDKGTLERFMASGALDIVVMDRISLLGIDAKSGGGGAALLGRYFYLDRKIGSFSVYRPRNRRS